MHWFLVISLLNTDEIIVKQMENKAECQKLKKEFNVKVRKKVSGILDVSCEEGEVMETYEVNKDELL
mgnify:FL=1